MLQRLVVAAGAALVAGQGTGVGGDFCGNILGADKALLDPIEGHGVLHYSSPSSAFPDAKVSIKNGMVITTLTAGSYARTAPVGVSKLTECIYSVEVNFADFSVQVKTGAPGSPPAAQRCWRFEKSESTVAFMRSAPGQACPIANSTADGAAIVGGSITDYTRAIPAGYGPECDLDLTAPANGGVALLYAGMTDGNPLSISGAGVWVQPKFIAYTVQPSTVRTLLTSATLTEDEATILFGATQVLQQCLIDMKPPSADSVNAGRLEAGLVVSAPTGYGAMCYGVGFDVGKGIAFMAAPTTAAAYDPENSAAMLATCRSSNVKSQAGAQIVAITVRSVPTTFANALAAFDAVAAAAGVKKPSALPPTALREEKREIVTTSVTLSGIDASTFTAADAVDPCKIFGIRAGIAKAAGVDVKYVQLTSVTLTTTPPFMAQLAGDSLANLLIAACPAAPAGARRLREDRALQTVSLSTGVNVIPTGGQSATALSTSLGNALASSTTVVASSFAQSSGQSNAAATASAPATTTATVSVVPEPIVRAETYEPSFDIKTFHMIPRFVLVGGGKATSTFTPTLDYAQGALFPAGGIIAFGAVFFLLYMAIYVLSCMCRCCCTRCRTKRDPDTYYSGCRKNCGTPRALVVMGIINIGLLLACLAYTPRFAQGIDKLFSAATDLSNTLKNTGDLMADTTPTGFTYKGTPNTKSLYVGTDAAVTSANIFQGRLVNPAWAAAPQGIRDMVSAIKDGAGTAKTLAHDTGSILKDTGKSFGDILDKVDIDVIKAQATLASYAVLGILSGILLLWSISVCKNSCSSFIYKVSSPLIILLVLLVTILTGAYYAIGIIGSDVCVDPSAALQSTLNFTGISGMPADSLNYYLKCGDDAYLPPMGAYKMVKDAQDQIAMAANQVETLETQAAADSSSTYDAIKTADATGTNGPIVAYVAASGSTPSSGTLADMVHGMVDAKTAVDSIASDQVSCKNIDGIIQKLYIGLCNDGFGTVIAMFRILIAASVLLICQLGVGVDVCCYHPGDSAAWGTAGDDKAQGGLELRQPAAPGTVPVAGRSKV